MVVHGHEDEVPADATGALGPVASDASKRPQRTEFRRPRRNLAISAQPHDRRRESACTTHSRLGHLKALSFSKFRAFHEFHGRRDKVPVQGT